MAVFLISRLVQGMKAGDKKFFEVRDHAEKRRIRQAAILWKLGR